MAKLTRVCASASVKTSAGSSFWPIMGVTPTSAASRMRGIAEGAQINHSGVCQAACGAIATVSSTARPLPTARSWHPALGASEEFVAVLAEVSH